MANFQAEYVRLRLDTANQDDIAYYTRRVAEERDLARSAAKDIARSAHLALAVIYEDYLRYLQVDAAQATGGRHRPRLQA